MTAVSFGVFVLDPETRELRRGGESVPLSPKAYQLLEMLVVNRPRALSKSELQERLWPDTFVVDKNLVNLVAEIREALGDNATHPQFVRTVPKDHYRCRINATRLQQGIQRQRNMRREGFEGVHGTHLWHGH